MKEYLNVDEKTKKTFKNSNNILQDHEFLSNRFDKDSFDKILNTSVYFESSSEEDEDEQEVHTED